MNVFTKCIISFALALLAIAAGLGQDCRRFGETCSMDAGRGSKDSCCIMQNAEDRHKVLTCYYSPEGEICQLSRCIGGGNLRRQNEPEACNLRRGMNCCNRNQTCVDKHPGYESGQCVDNVGLCIAGTSESSSEQNCMVDTITPREKCCSPGDDTTKKVGKCVDSICKCIADDQECTSEDVCCNEGKQTLSCREGKCQKATEDERKECMNGIGVSDPYPGNKCSKSSSDPKQTCCTPGDNPDKTSGECSSYGLCLCSKDNEHCGGGPVCCNEGRNGIACRHQMRDAVGSPLKCLTEDLQIKKCTSEGSRCTGIYGYDPCCGGLGCRWENKVCGKL